jgi:hypothetical protein
MMTAGSNLVMAAAGYRRAARLRHLFAQRSIGRYATNQSGRFRQ